MTLDDRARKAARNLMEKVDQAPLLLMQQGVPAVRRSRGSPRLLSFAGAFAAVMLLVGLTLVQVDLFSPKEDATANDTFPVNTVTTEETTSTTASPTTTSSTVPAVIPPETTSTIAAVDGTPPPLVITSPENGARVTEKSFRFEGTTEPGAIVAAGPYFADVDDEGHWSIVLLLNVGGNLAAFTATDPAGNVAEASVSVTYDPPTPPKEESPEFTAHNTWGTCAENPPYDEYYGTGKPGTVVHVVSAYGSGSTTVAANGEWYVKVYFEAAPYGKTFEVKAKDAFGAKVYFEFTSLVEK